jgi:hypothetical protein
MATVKTHVFFDLTPNRLAAELSKLTLNLNHNKILKGIYIFIEETVVETEIKPEVNTIQLERLYSLLVITSNIQLNKKQIANIMKSIPFGDRR